MPDATIKQIADFFRQDGEGLSAFAAEWKALAEKDKDEIKRGIGDGSFTY